MSSRCARLGAHLPPQLVSTHTRRARACPAAADSYRRTGKHTLRANKETQRGHGCAVLRCAVCCDALRRAAPDPNRAEIHRSFDDRQVVGAVEEHGVHRHRKRHRKLVVEQVLDHGLRRPALGSASHTTNAVDRGRPATEAQAQAQARGSGQAAYLAVLEGVFQAALPPARGGHLCVRRTGVWTPDGRLRERRRPWHARV